jgi:hypothetical protein
MLSIAEQIFAQKSHHCRLDLDNLVPSPEFSVDPAQDEELPYLVKMAARQIAGLQGTCLAVEQVHRYSRSILAVRKRHELVGCFATMLLNQSGIEALLDGSLSIAEPSRSHLVQAGETAAAIYVWAICGHRMAVAAAGNVMRWLRQAPYARADLYARPATPEGKKLMIRAGFQALLGSEANSLWVYRRPSCVERKTYPGIEGFERDQEDQMTASTADDLEMPARTLFAAASAVLLGLAKGKYDGQMEVTGQFLKDLAVVLPPTADIEKALEVFLFLTKTAASAAVVPNGNGRYVPSTNSRYNQETLGVV